MTETPMRKGDYIGQCRLDYNILYQWDGQKWVRVPDVFYPDKYRSRLIFDAEDALHDTEDAVDRAFKP